VHIVRDLASTSATRSRMISSETGQIAELAVVGRCLDVVLRWRVPEARLGAVHPCSSCLGLRRQVVSLAGLSWSPPSLRCARTPLLDTVCRTVRVHPR
jgi:hypothetical protein